MVTTGCRLLWEFLAEQLVSSSAADVIRWEDESSLKFKVIDPQRLAELWGREKGKTGMTYEKLSRALRYYYKTQIVAKVRGQRLTYRLLVYLLTNLLACLHTCLLTYSSILSKLHDDIVSNSI